MPSILRFPRPRSFFYIVSLRTAAEFITLCLAINKVTGLYGVLALFTGYALNPLQFSHYIYSLLVLGLVAYLSPAIRDRNRVLHNVALAWIYVVDTLVNMAYTALFGMGWFILLAQHLNEPVPVDGSGTGKSTMDSTAGFTDPSVPASEVDIHVAPGDGSLGGQDAVAVPSTSNTGTVGGAVFQSGSMMSLTVITFLFLVRIYFCIVMLSFARTTVRGHIASTSASDPSYASTSSTDPTMAASPFVMTGGWQGKLGRAMLKFPTRRYWLGRDESEEEWLRATSGRFGEGGASSSARALKISVPNTGVGERERRARSGTGPPVPVGLGRGKTPQ